MQNIGFSLAVIVISFGVGLFGGDSVVRRTIAGRSLSQRLIRSNLVLSLILALFFALCDIVLVVVATGTSEIGVLALYLALSALSTCIGGFSIAWGIIPWIECQSSK